MEVGTRMGPKVTIRWAVRILVCCFIWGGVPYVRAQSVGDTTTFLGTDILAAPGAAVIAKDVNVRAGPKTKAKKVGSLRRGKRVGVAGYAKSDKGWTAVLQDGEPLGFVYGEMLMHVIDGKLTERLIGETARPNGQPCTYAIRFDGKSPVEGGLFEVSDYTLKLRCGEGDKRLKVDLPMFMTEAPFRLGSTPEFQITIDIVEISDGYDQVYSVTSIYHGTKETIKFDSTTIADFTGSPDKKTYPATSIHEALKRAVQLAVSAWNDKVWTTLEKAAE